MAGGTIATSSAVIADKLIEDTWIHTRQVTAMSTVSKCAAWTT